VGCFFLGKQKVVLFPKYRENGWEAAASALICNRLQLQVEKIQLFNKCHLKSINRYAFLRILIIILSLSQINYTTL